MQQNLIDFQKLNIEYIVGNCEQLYRMHSVQALEIFDDKVMAFLETLSRILLSDKEAKTFADVVTLGFWLRKSSIEHLKTRFGKKDEGILKLGRGIAFHIAPSNVPVNYAYSLVSGLLCGNKNVVRIPTKEFQQVDIINRAIKQAIDQHPHMTDYICLIRYGHETNINDALSAIADIRVIWGGDRTIEEIRKSPLKPRATEITFADRFSLAVIDSDYYMEQVKKESIALDFYNDTYLTDQNACTSPKLVVWTGKRKEEAKTIFWNELHKLVFEKYDLSGVQAVNKLTSGYLAAVQFNQIQKIAMEDNLIVRLRITELSPELIDIRENSGFFYEYDCEDILDLKSLCDDKGCQTISYIGAQNMFNPLLSGGINGVDRIVPIGKTMDFDLLWDGYNLVESMSRNITIG